MRTDMTREQLSALMDGEGEFSAPSAHAAAFVREVAMTDAARGDWLLYAQIGDVLRSADLAPMPHEDDFLHKVSAVIAREPIVLQPQAAQLAQVGQVAAQRSAAHRRPHWSTRMAAGMAAVAGVAVMAWVALPSLQTTQHPTAIQAGSERPVVAALSNGQANGSAQMPVNAVRPDPRAFQVAQAGLMQADLSAPPASKAQLVAVSAQVPMVEYLLAHQQMAGGIMPVAPATLRVMAAQGAGGSAQTGPAR